MRARAVKDAQGFWGAYSMVWAGIGVVGVPWGIWMMGRGLWRLVSGVPEPVEQLWARQSIGGAALVLASVGCILMVTEKRWLGYACAFVAVAVVLWSRSLS